MNDCSNRSVLCPTLEDRTPALALKPVRIALRSRFWIAVLRLVLRPWFAWILRGPPTRIARLQLLTAGRRWRDAAGPNLAYRVLGDAPHAVPGHVVGDPSHRERPVLLYLHGGAFVLPAAADLQGRLLVRLCRALEAVGFMPDYRLAPANRFPAALDDCERAYRALLALGFDARRIVLIGESAGGNLVLGVLQRIRAARLPMPAGAIPISAGTEFARLHGLPARTACARRDAVLSIASLHHLTTLYAGERDLTDPELSPLYADLRGFPPLYLIASADEVLRDDSVGLAYRARESGVPVKLELWPRLPHAFPLFESLFPEARQAREDIVAFARACLAGRAS